MLTIEVLSNVIDDIDSDDWSLRLNFIYIPVYIYIFFFFLFFFLHHYIYNWNYILYNLWKIYFMQFKKGLLKTL